MTRDRDIAAPEQVVSRPSILWIQGLPPDMPYMLVCPYGVYSATGSAYAVYLYTIPLYTHSVHMAWPGDHLSRGTTHEVYGTAHFMPSMT